MRNRTFSVVFATILQQLLVWSSLPWSCATSASFKGMLSSGGETDCSDKFSQWWEEKGFQSFKSYGMTETCLAKLLPEIWRLRSAENSASDWQPYKRYARSMIVDELGKESRSNGDNFNLRDAKRCFRFLNTASSEMDSRWLRLKRRHGLTYRWQGYLLFG